MTESVAACGYKDHQNAPMFRGAPTNVHMPHERLSQLERRVGLEPGLDVGALWMFQ